MKVGIAILAFACYACLRVMMPVEDMFYSGIGSRESEGDVKVEADVRQCTDVLSALGATCRTGGADGTDLMFERHTVGHQEIYLPWKDFNAKHRNYAPGIVFSDCAGFDAAMAMAKRFHPNWNALSHYGRRLMGRNSMQVFGANMDLPVDFVLCWTRNGLETGGTSQALRIAKANNIPIFNLGLPTGKTDFLQFIENKKNK